MRLGHINYSLKGKQFLSTRLHHSRELLHPSLAPFNLHKSRVRRASHFLLTAFSNTTRRTFFSDLSTHPGVASDKALASSVRCQSVNRLRMRFCTLTTYYGTEGFFFGVHRLLFPPRLCSLFVRPHISCAYLIERESLPVSRIPCFSTSRRLRRAQTPAQFLQ